MCVIRIRMHVCNMACTVAHCTGLQCRVPLREPHGTLGTISSINRFTWLAFGMPVVAAQRLHLTTRVKVDATGAFYVGCVFHSVRVAAPLFYSSEGRKRTRHAYQPMGHCVIDMLLSLRHDTFELLVA